MVISFVIFVLVGLQVFLMMTRNAHVSLQAIALFEISSLYIAFMLVFQWVSGREHC